MALKRDVPQGKTDERGR